MKLYDKLTIALAAGCIVWAAWKTYWILVTP